MKAITLHQPWASLIAEGFKTVETRSWSTDHRGPIAIHAGKTMWTAHIFEATTVGLVVEGWSFGRADIWHCTLPLGAIVATAVLSDVVPAAQAAADWPGQRRWGDLSPSRWGWILTDVVALSDPIEVAGRQRLWTVPDHVADRLAVGR